VVVEGCGLRIHELDGFPGALTDRVLGVAGADGLVRLADLTVDRRCHIERAVAYVDRGGNGRALTQAGDSGSLVTERLASGDQLKGSWRELWDVFVPAGLEAPVSTQGDGVEHLLENVSGQSVFAQLEHWLLGSRNVSNRSKTSDGDVRLRSSYLAFDFPAERVAVRPREGGHDLLLVLNRDHGIVEHHNFTELPELLPYGSLVIVNNSRVVKAALRLDVDRNMFLRVLTPFSESLEEVQCLCLSRPAKGEIVPINGGSFMVEREVRSDDDLRVGRILPDDPSVRTLQEFMERYGTIPIPNYVSAQRAADDAEYQTAYASTPGSVACPTAGLHITEEILASLYAAKHEVAEVTLHIGYGTWKSLSSEFVDQHEMDAERCEIARRTLRLVRDAKASGRTVVAVGTSSVRTLETFADEILEGRVEGPLQRDTSLFIAPPYEFRVVDRLITNFAHPQTPIVALAAAFAGSVDLLYRAYQEAVDHGEYQFLYYGDGMLIR
jgi:S-adenosylmethionine:tRNA ribosyltransferase-isomerase